MISVFDFRGARFEHLSDVVHIPLAEAEPLISARVGRLIEWWRGESLALGHLPAKTDFDIADHFVLAAYLYLAERGEDGAFWYRLRGELSLWMFGGAERGRAVGSYGIKDYDHDLAAYYESVLTGGRPVVCRGDIWFDDGRSALFESVDCPLADEAGRPRFILGLADIVDRPDDPA